MAKKKKAEKTAQKVKSSARKEEFQESPSLDMDEESEEEAPKKKGSSKSKDSSGSVYKIIEVVGSSSKSWEHAAQVAVDRASQTLEDLRIAEVVDQDLKIEDGSIVAYRTKLRLSFKFRD